MRQHFFLAGKWHGALFLAALCQGLLALPPVSAAPDAATRLAQVRQERARLAHVRQLLEQQLGGLGKELKSVDMAIVEAHRESRQAAERAKAAAGRLAQLEAREHRLSRRVQKLRGRMQGEVAAAWRRAGSRSLSLLALSHASIAEIPHRRYMLARLLDSQEQDRRAYMEALAELNRLRAEARHRRDELEALHRQKVKAEQELAIKRRAKRALWQRLKKDVRLAAQRDRNLASQETALRQLLAGLRTRLSATDAAAGWVPIRRLRGRLAWPLKGRIVAAFGSRPAPARPRLSGIRLAPIGRARQVRAIAAGQVRYADWFGGYGLMMIVDHGDGVMSVYAHNSAFFRRLGDWVEAGEVLAEAGNTGWAKRISLYFEIRDGGKAVDPLGWLARR